MNTNRSVAVIGWFTIIGSAFIILTELFGLMFNDSMNQLAPLLNMFPQSKTASFATMMDIFEYDRIWSFYTIVYFAGTFVGGILFVRYREPGRKILEIACWVGILNACVDSVISYLLWESMESMIAGLVGGIGMPLAQLNPLGLGAIILGFFLWVVPSIGMLVYLRKPALKELMKQSGLRSEAGPVHRSDVPDPLNFNSRLHNERHFAKYTSAEPSQRCQNTLCGNRAMQTWKTISRSTILDHSKFLKVERHTIELPDGRVVNDWPWVIKPDYINVLAVTEEDKFLCFRQTKYAVEGTSLAPVGGYMEPGENPLAAAKRELREEMGYEASAWHSLGVFVVDGNHGAGTGHLFLAQHARRTTKPIVDDLEEQELLFLNKEEVERALANGEFKVMAWATTVALALLALERKG